jgi:class 3 adenylate cyclase/tRNA A-37 threonylcarbamoyl transferase component Bud32
MSLDRYEIISELGRGGFGVVYKARQLTTGQFVAIKMLHRLRELDEELRKRQVARFQREMMLCAQLHHPHIVRLIDSGFTRDGQIYMAFEYIPGESLAAFLAKRGALNPVEARHLMLQVLDALSCAHAQGVVHRDLKPHNIMVVATGARLNALVLDFGLAALVGGPEVQDHTRLTRTFEMLGTPAYAAPEQFRGLPPTPATDFFSWALVFLECLTGARPIPGRTFQEILLQMLGPASIPMPPALRAHPLGQLLARLLSKDVQGRGQLRGDWLLREFEACNVSDLKQGQGAHAYVPALGAKQGVADAADEGPSRTVTMMDRQALPPVGEAHPPRKADDRRQATALYCTLTVSTISGQGVDFEESDECIRIGQQLCAEIARSFGGILGGVLGDQVLLCFGPESAPSEGARHAAYAALEILQRVRQHNAQLEQQRRVRLEVRASLHTGSVGTNGSGQPVGMPPRAAARLSAQAVPWEIVVSADTAPLLQGGFILEPIVERQGYGLAAPEVLRLGGALRHEAEAHARDTP